MARSFYLRSVVVVVGMAALGAMPARAEDGFRTLWNQTAFARYVAMVDVREAWNGSGKYAAPDARYAVARDNVSAWNAQDGWNKPWVKLAIATAGNAAWNGTGGWDG